MNKNAPLKNIYGKNVPHSQVLGAPYQLKGGKMVKDSMMSKKMSPTKVAARKHKTVANAAGKLMGGLYS